MGQFLCSKVYTPCEEDWPYFWAINETKLLISNDEKDPDLPVEIMPWLLLSDLPHVRDSKLLLKLGVTHVLNMASGYCYTDDYSKLGINTLGIDANDEPGYKILTLHFDEAFQFIESARLSGGICVVHCVAGVNRSGVIAASYMMMYTKKNVLDVVSYCRSQRGSDFLRNESFQEELVAMARYFNLLGLLPGKKGCIVQKKAPKVSFLALRRRSERSSRTSSGHPLS